MSIITSDYYMSNDGARTGGGGTMWELGEAEQLMKDATTPEERAFAMQRYSEAMRNMLMGTLAPSFERAMGSVVRHEMGLQTDRYAATVADLKREVITRLDVQWNEFDEFKEDMKTGIRSLHTGFLAIGEKVNQLESDVGELKIVQETHGTAIGELKDDVSHLKKVVDDHQGRIIRIERVMRISAEEAGAASTAGDILDQWEQTHPAPDFRHDAKR